MRKVRAGNIEPHRLGAGREQERVVAMLAAVRELNVPARGVDRCHARPSFRSMSCSR